MDKKNSFSPIYKPSALIAISLSKEISALQAKMYNIFLFNAKKQLNINPSERKFTIRVSEIKKISKTRQVNKFIKNAFYDLLDTKVKYNILGKDPRQYPIEGGFVLIAGYESRPGVFTYNFAEQIIDVLLDPNIYTALDLNAIASLKSKYSIKLYELCKDYENSPSIPLLRISDFRDIFNVGDKYRDGENLRRYVLEPAVSEVNERKIVPYLVSYQINRNRGSKNRFESVKIKLLKENDKRITECKNEINEKEPFLFDMLDDNPLDYGAVIGDILNYLNRKLSTKTNPVKFKKTKETEKLVKARISEGYDIENFKSVIDKKYSEWRNTDMAKHLRPDVLFGDKFDIYLNQLSATADYSAGVAVNDDWLSNRLREKKEEKSLKTVLISDVLDDFLKNKTNKRFEKNENENCR